MWPISVSHADSRSCSVRTIREDGDAPPSAQARSGVTHTLLVSKSEMNRQSREWHDVFTTSLPLGRALATVDRHLLSGRQTHRPFPGHRETSENGSG